MWVLVGVNFWQPATKGQQKANLTSKVGHFQTLSSKCGNFDEFPWKEGNWEVFRAEGRIWLTCLLLRLGILPELGTDGADPWRELRHTLHFVDLALHCHRATP